MPVLSNAMHERFCQSIVGGMSASAAYVAAGFKANRGNATRLNANESIQARIAELKQGAEAQFTLSRAQWLEWLKRLAAKAERLGDVSSAKGCLREIGLAMSDWYATEKLQVDAADPLLAVLARARQRK